MMFVVKRFSCMGLYNLLFSTCLRLATPLLESLQLQKSFALHRRSGQWHRIGCLYLTASLSFTCLSYLKLSRQSTHPQQPRTHIFSSFSSLPTAIPLSLPLISTHSILFSVTRAQSSMTSRNNGRKSKANGKQPKPFERPSAAAFREAAARLDFINNMAPKWRVPIVLDLSSDSEDSVVGPSSRASKTTPNQWRPAPVFSPTSASGSGWKAEEKTKRAPSERRLDGWDKSSPTPGPSKPRQRPLVHDSEDEGTLYSLRVGIVSYLIIVECLTSSYDLSKSRDTEGTLDIRRSSTSPAPNRAVSPSISSEYEHDSGDSSSDNEHVVEEKFDLRIKMLNWENTWNCGHPARRKAETMPNPSTRRQRSVVRSPRDQGPSTTAPSYTGTTAQTQLSDTPQASSTSQDAGYSAKHLTARLPGADAQTPRSSHVRVEIPRKYGSRHRCHDGCDVPLQTVEQSHARQERANLRAKRRN